MNWLALSLTSGIILVVVLIGYFEYKYYINYPSQISGEIKILVIAGVDYAHYKYQYDKFLKQFQIIKIAPQREFDIIHYYIKSLSSLTDELKQGTIYKVLPTNLVIRATAFDIIRLD